MVTIQSDELSVKIEEHGAQMRSLFDRKRNVERLWPGNPTVWASSAPVVFPVIGKLNGLEYHLAGKTYGMKSNGLIRYADPAEVSTGESWAEFVFRDDEDTRSRFPFAWTFSIRYELSGAKLSVAATISNDGDAPFWYNYAGHPGFRVPLHEGESCDSYYVEFSKREHISIYDVCSTGQLTGELTPFFDGERRFFLRKELFHTEALAFHAPESEFVSIKSLNDDSEIRVRIKGFDNVAVWSPYASDRKLEFICIEPWIGHSDFKGFEGDFSQRDGIAQLSPHDSVQHVFDIEVR